MAVIKDARYTSPGGNEYFFSFGNLSRTTELKTGIFTYPMRDGATVQHQGRGAMTFPLACIFHGANCMAAASAFEAALTERGAGELQHPIYGTHMVKPTGSILREDPLVTGSNQSIVTITFTESIDDEDETQLNEVAADIIDENHELFEISAAEDFAMAVATVELVGEQLAVTAALEAQSQALIDNLQPLAMSDSRSFADWLASANELKDSIRRLYDRGMTAARRIENAYVRALNVARLTLRLMRLPARLATTLSSKIQGYAALTATLINQFRNDPFDTRKIRNAYATAMLGLSSAVASIASGAAISTARASSGANTQTSTGPAAARISGGVFVGADQNTGTSSREEAVETADRILEMLESVTAFSDVRIAPSTYDTAALEAIEEQAALTALAAQEAQSAQEAMAREAELIWEMAHALPEAQDALAAMETLAELSASTEQATQDAQTAQGIHEIQSTQTLLAEKAILTSRAALEAQSALELLAAQTLLPALAIQASQTAETAQAVQIARSTLANQANQTAQAAQTVLDDTTGSVFVDANSVSYINLKTLVLQSVKLIKNASFALPMQRIFTLDRDRQVIELCAELYGTVDFIDNFIVSNNFSIDEIELLPMGTKVMHYV